MPKTKYILKAVAGTAGYSDDKKEQHNRPFEKNLLNLSSLGIRWNTSLIRSMRAIGANDNDQINAFNTMPPNANVSDDDYLYGSYNIVGEDNFIALFDQTYAARRDFLRKFALQGEIRYVLEEICNSTIIMDTMNYFAYPDTKRLKSRLKEDRSEQIIDDLNAAFRRVYHAWRFNEGLNAWQWVYKFLIDGFLCFEIVYRTNQNNGQAEVISCFQEIDPTTIEPVIKYDINGNEYKVWIQYKGDSEKERELLDANVIYISWAKNNYISRLSYVENLVRPFNMLRTIENSHVIWNVQNAQKRINVNIPGGAGSEQRNRGRIDEIKAYFKEDLNIDDDSGTLMVNGQPKFQFYKTFFTTSKNGEKVEISEIEHNGQDMSIEYMKYFWQRFIIETELPKDRFSMLLGDGNPAPFIKDQSSLTQEDYKFSLFVKKIRSIIQELLIKPTWLQFCIKYPEFESNDILKSSFGIKFVEEELFTRERERKIMESAANTMNSLLQLKQPDGKTPIFATRFILEKVVGFSEDEWKVNEKYLKEEQEEQNKQQGGGDQQQGGGDPFGGGGGDPFGGGGADLGGGDAGGDPFGGGGDMGGGDAGGDPFGGGGADLGGEAPAPTGEAPAPSENPFG